MTQLWFSCLEQFLFRGGTTNLGSYLGSLPPPPVVLGLNHNFHLFSSFTKRDEMELGLGGGGVLASFQLTGYRVIKQKIAQNEFRDNFVRTQTCVLKKPCNTQESLQGFDVLLLVK